MHWSVDIAGEYRTPVKAPQAIHFWYGHPDNINRTQEGQTVQKGDVIGLMGTTGRSIGVHLHFETRCIIPRSGKRIGERIEARLSSTEKSGSAIGQYQA